MNKYIRELFEILSDIQRCDGISEFEITIADNILEIRKASGEMLRAVLEFVKRNDCGAELINGAITVKIERNF